ncbi:MAG: SEC-C domain-containing protein [candidate division Zixibacteria bacterium]|nr:SEC-C domain-containing protein [candidate division Zixibacteria bacterium]
MKKLGRNERCWCGSGRKYKICHLDRENQKAPVRQDYLELLKEQDEKGWCMVPPDLLKECQGQIIRAHTIPLSSGLRGISENHHVYRMLRGAEATIDSREPLLKPKLVGIRKASTFRGFCSKHDDELFAAIEKSEFKLNQNHIFLLVYRSLCMELFTKQRNLHSLDFQRQFDRGTTLEKQIVWQQRCDAIQRGLELAIRDLSTYKAELDSLLLGQRFEHTGYLALVFANAPQILCSGLIQPQIDLCGRPLQNLGDKADALEYMTVVLLPYTSGSVFIVAWIGPKAAPLAFAESLRKVNELDSTNMVVRIIFSLFENTYCAPSWWDGLPDSAKTKLMERLNSHLPYRPQTIDWFKEDGFAYVNWSLKERIIEEAVR